MKFEVQEIKDSCQSSQTSVFKQAVSVVRWKNTENYLIDVALSEKSASVEKVWDKSCKQSAFLSTAK